MVRHVLFVLALVVQLGILAYAPVGKMAILRNGRPVTLRIASSSVFDMLRSSPVTLNFEIGYLPGLEEGAIERGEPVYTVLTEDDEGVWNAIRWEKEFPEHMEEGEVVIRGRGSRWGRLVVYGIEKYFLPEAERAAVEEAFTGAGKWFLVDVAVDSDGDAAVLRLRVGDTVYEY
jgi:uncharacterized membrane-anchored protein